jgi:hypothetical protein
MVPRPWSYESPLERILRLQVSPTESGYGVRHLLFPREAEDFRACELADVTITNADKDTFVPAARPKPEWFSGRVEAHKATLTRRQHSASLEAASPTVNSPRRSVRSKSHPNLPTTSSIWDLLVTGLSCLPKMVS